jgi:dolichol kinase
LREKHGRSGALKIDAVYSPIVIQSVVRQQEWVRKLLRIPGGLAPPVVVLVFGWTGAVAINIFLLAYFFTGWDLSRRGFRLPLLWALITRTRREHEPEPIAAAEFQVALLVLGVLFPLPYFFAAVALLGVGDGLASIAGQLLRGPRLPWNPRKTWAGLLVGAGAGTAAYVAFAITGGLMQAEGYARGSTLTGTPPTWWVLAFLPAGFLLLHAGARLAVRAGWATRHANAPPHVVVAAFAVALAPAVAFLLVGPLVLDGPILPTLGGHSGLVRAALVAVPVVVMVVESFLRRHDNLWVPGLTAAGAYVLVGVLNRALGAA